MTLKEMLDSMIDFMIANPSSDGATGGGFAVAQLGITPEDVPGFMGAVGAAVVNVGLVTTPSSWNKIRDKVVEIGPDIAKTFIESVIKAGDILKAPGIQTVILKKQISQLQPGIDAYAAKVSVASYAIGVETNELLKSVIEDGRGVNVAASAALTRTRDMLQSQLDTLTNL